MTARATDVIQHYDTGAMLDRIKAGLAAAGVDPGSPTPQDLKAVDEFHTGGLEATKALLEPLGLSADMTGLDVGCGIGGTARFIAESYGCDMVGIDLTPAFVEVANALSTLCGMGDQTQYQVGSALQMPVSDSGFDFATMMHVGMNVEDKPALMRNVARALKPGGRFALFDIMDAGGGPVDFPVPWSSVPDTSFVAAPEVYRDAAKAAGLTLEAERNRGAYAKAFFERAAKSMAERGPAPVGLQLIMGDQAQTRYGNAAKAAFEGKTEPWEMVFRKP